LDIKIKDIRTEVYLVEQPPIILRKDYPKEGGKVPVTIVRIITDGGIEGFAFGAQDIAEPIVSKIKSEIIGRDPLDREWIWQRLWYLYDYGRNRPFPLRALSAIDVVLWDIAGKALGVPIYKLMGAYRDKIKIYASSWGLPTTQDYVNEIIACKKQGITAYKIHPNDRVGKKDIEVCRAAREAVGDDMTLMLDVGGCYSREEALWVGKELERLNFYWFEEPIPDHDIEGLIKLREKLDIPISATETNQLSMFGIPEYILRRAVDIIRCDISLGGGITPCKKIADMCNAFGMQCQFHTNWYPTGNVANLQIACGVKNCEHYEMIWPEWRYGLRQYPELDDEGCIHVPQKPGLGVEIDWEAFGEPVEKY